MTPRLPGGVALACLALLLVPCCSDGDARERSEGLTFRSTKVVVRWKVGEFAGRDDRGRPITDRDLRGRTWVATFFFMRCTGPCPDMIRALKQVEKETADVEDLRLVAFTIDPENDTVEALGEYADGWRVDHDRFHFVRLPTREAVQELQASFRATAPEDTHHTPNFFLIDGEGYTRRWWDARLEDERASLVHDLRRLARGENLGS